MKNWFSPVLSGIASAAATWLLTIGATKMPAIASDFLSTFWPLLVGGVVGLIVWNVQFFKHYKKEKDAEFQSWLTAQEANWQQHFNNLARKGQDEWEIAKSSIHHFCQNNEARLSKLEQANRQKQDEKVQMPPKDQGAL